MELIINIFSHLNICPGRPVLVAYTAKPLIFKKRAATKQPKPLSLYITTKIEMMRFGIGLWLLLSFTWFRARTTQSMSVVKLPSVFRQPMMKWPVVLCRELPLQPRLPQWNGFRCLVFGHQQWQICQSQSGLRRRVNCSISFSPEIVDFAMSGSG